MKKVYTLSGYGWQAPSPQSSSWDAGLRRASHVSAISHGPAEGAPNPTYGDFHILDESLIAAYPVKIHTFAASALLWPH